MAVDDSDSTLWNDQTGPAQGIVNATNLVSTSTGGLEDPGGA